MSTILLHQDLVDLLEYIPETGLFFWKKKRRGIQTGKPLGSNNGFGYLRITVLGRSYYAHRLAWFYMTKSWANEIDHINGIRHDNRFENLRDVDRQTNAQNKRFAQKNSKSHVLGVSWHRKANKWQAHICVAKERKYLGLFNDINEAHVAYLMEKERIDHGRS